MQDSSYNDDMDDPVRQLIVGEAEKLGESLSSLSKKLGKNHAYLQQFVKRHVPAELPEGIRAELAGLLSVEEMKLRGPTAELAAKAVSSSGQRPPLQFLGERDLPVYASAEGGAGTMVISTDPIEMVPRPWYLGNVREGYAVLVIGDSMEPSFEAGDLAVVNPRLPPMRNKNVILVADEHEGGFTATIKRLLGWTDREWRLRQFNPKKDFALPRKEWPKALRVVGKYDGG